VPGATSSSQQRYEAFLDRVGAGESAWTFRGEQGQGILELEPGVTVPVWSSRDAAAAAQASVFEGDDPVELDPRGLVDLLEDTIADEELVGVDLDVEEGSVWLAPAGEVLADVAERLGRGGRDPDAPSDAEVDRVYALDADDRYEWFVVRCAARGAGWAIGDEESLVSTESDDGRSVLLLWPDAAFAQRFRDENGIEHDLQRLPWDHLLSELGRAADAGELAGVFASDDDEYATVEPDALREQLERARREGR
jgi:hypothetical protein